MFRIPQLIILVALALTANPALAATDPSTHMPVFPGSAFTSKSTQSVCNIKVAEAIYSSVHGNLATVER